MGLLSRPLQLRWSGPPQSLGQVAKCIHERIREGVLLAVGKGEPVHFVCGGLAKPPGPVRLVFEDRRRGLPGRRFSATIERNKSEFVLTVRTSLLRPIPTAFLDTIRGAVTDSPGIHSCTPWK